VTKGGGGGGGGGRYNKKRELKRRVATGRTLHQRENTKNGPCSKRPVGPGERETRVQEGRTASATIFMERTKRGTTNYIQIFGKCPRETEKGGGKASLKKTGAEVYRRRPSAWGDGAGGQWSI